MPKPVDGRSVDPVDAGIERGVDRFDGFVVVLRAPAESPSSAADSPGTDADGGEMEVAVTEFLHRSSLFVVRSSF